MISRNLNYKFLLLIKILLIYLFFFTKPFAIEKSELKNITEGSENAKIEILVYESLTCPHCAKFHKEIYPDLKKDFILIIISSSKVMKLQLESNKQHQVYLLM